MLKVINTGFVYSGTKTNNDTFHWLLCWFGCRWQSGASCCQLEVFYAPAVNDPDFNQSGQSCCCCCFLPSQLPHFLDVALLLLASPKSSSFSSSSFFSSTFSSFSPPAPSSTSQIYFFMLLGLMH